MKKAFTLIELLIVIAIIGILAGILFVSIGTKPIQKSRDTKRVADIQNLRTALTLYYSDSNVYPATIIDGATLTAFLAAMVPNYIAVLPRAPMFDDASGAAACTATPNMPIIASAAGDYGYYYAYTGAGGTVTLSTCLEEATNNPNDISTRFYTIQFK